MSGHGCIGKAYVTVMRFSIITPSYNSGVYLEQTIKSVLMQQEEGIDLEYIVVDGGSSDHTHEVLDKYRRDISHLIVGKDTGRLMPLIKGWLSLQVILYHGWEQMISIARVPYSACGVT